MIDLSEFTDKPAEVLAMLEDAARQVGTARIAVDIKSRLGIVTLEVECVDGKIVDVQTSDREPNTQALATARATREAGEIVTPAEFKALREMIGYSTGALARRWGLKTDRAIIAWENEEKPLPVSRAREFRELVDLFLERVDELAESGASVVDVPRIDSESPDDHPAAWHRAIAAQADIRMNYL